VLSLGRRSVSCHSSVRAACQSTAIIVYISFKLLITRRCPGGFVRSYSPRLTAASRIFLFYPIFLLTSAQSITYVSHMTH
jgi:hypothetical protein